MGVPSYFTLYEPAGETETNTIVYPAGATPSSLETEYVKAGVGAAVGGAVGAAVGAAVGGAVSLAVGEAVGVAVGATVSVGLDVSITSSAGERVVTSVVVSGAKGCGSSANCTKPSKTSVSLFEGSVKNIVSTVMLDIMKKCIMINVIFLLFFLSISSITSQ